MQRARPGVLPTNCHMITVTPTNKKTVTLYIPEEVLQHKNIIPSEIVPKGGTEQLYAFSDEQTMQAAVDKKAIKGNAVILVGADTDLKKTAFFVKNSQLLKARNDEKIREVEKEKKTEITLSKPLITAKTTGKVVDDQATLYLIIDSTIKTGKAAIPLSPGPLKKKETLLETLGKAFAYQLAQNETYDEQYYIGYISFNKPKAHHLLECDLYFTHPNSGNQAERCTITGDQIRKSKSFAIQVSEQIVKLGVPAADKEAIHGAVVQEKEEAARKIAAAIEAQQEVKRAQQIKIKENLREQETLALKNIEFLFKIKQEDPLIQAIDNYKKERKKLADALAQITGESERLIASITTGKEYDLAELHERLKIPSSEQESFVLHKKIQQLKKRMTKLDAKLVSCQEKANHFLEEKWRSYEKELVKKYQTALLDAVNTYLHKQNKKDPAKNSLAELKDTSIFKFIEQPLIKGKRVIRLTESAFEQNSDALSKIIIQLRESLGNEHPLSKLLKINIQAINPPQVADNLISSKILLARREAAQDIIKLTEQFYKEGEAVNFLNHEEKKHIQVIEEELKFIQLVRQQSDKVIAESQTKAKNLFDKIQELQTRTQATLAEISVLNKEMKITLDLPNIEFNESVALIENLPKQISDETEEDIQKIKSKKISRTEAHDKLQQIQRKTTDMFTSPDQALSEASETLKKLEAAREAIAIKLANFEAQKTLYKTLNILLTEQIPYWKAQQNQLRGGVTIVDEKGKIVRVPTGIGEMIKILDPTRTPSPAPQKFINLFFNPPEKKHNLSSTKTMPLSAPEIGIALEKIHQQAIDRLQVKDFLGKKKRWGREETTQEFYRKLKLGKLDSTANIQSLTTQLQTISAHPTSSTHNPSILQRLLNSSSHKKRR